MTITTIPMTGTGLSHRWLLSESASAPMCAAAVSVRLEATGVFAGAGVAGGNTVPAYALARTRKAEQGSPPRREPR